MSFPGLIFMILGVSAVALVLARRAKDDPRGYWVRAPRRRPPLVRAACGLLGFGLLAALGIGTWLDARAPYADTPAEPAGELRQPTRPAPASSRRYLLHFVLTRTTPVESRVVQVVEHEFRLPQDAGRKIEPAFSIPGYEVEFSCSIDDVRTAQDGTLQPRGRYELSVRRFQLQTTSGGTLHESRIALLGRADRGKSAFSLSPGLPHHYVLSCLPARVAEDDPLRTVSAAEGLRERLSELRSALDEVGFSLGVEETAPGAMGLTFLYHLGVTSFLLLLAANLLAQTARRRSLALAGWLAATVLLVIAMDRAAVGLHASRLRNPQASTRDRRIACVRLADTFFFRATAVRAVEPRLKDPALGDLPRSVHAALNK